MSKINRVMNEIEYWEDIVNKNNLKIERKATSCKKIQSLRFSNFFDGTEKLHVEFKINKDNKVISLVNQYINLELLDNHIINIVDFNMITEYIKKQCEDYLYHQKLYITYLSNDEAKIFNIEAGNPIIIIEKKLIKYNQIVFYEEELSRCEQYIFKEMDHE